MRRKYARVEAYDLRRIKGSMLSFVSCFSSSLNLFSLSPLTDLYSDNQPLAFYAFILYSLLKSFLVVILVRIDQQISFTSY